MDERVEVEVRHNDFTNLWEVHGTRVSYWMFEHAARTRADEVQVLLDAKWQRARQARLAPGSRAMV